MNIRLNIPVNTPDGEVKVTRTVGTDGKQRYAIQVGSRVCNVMCDKVHKHGMITVLDQLRRRAWVQHNPGRDEKYKVMLTVLLKLREGKYA